MHLPTLTTLALSLGLVSANSGFYASCHNFSRLAPKSTPTRFGGDCRQKSGIYTVGDRLNIDRCFGNHCGKLVAQYKSVIPLTDVQDSSIAHVAVGSVEAAKAQEKRQRHGGAV